MPSMHHPHVSASAFPSSLYVTVAAYIFLLPSLPLSPPPAVSSSLPSRSLTLAALTHSLGAARVRDVPPRAGGARTSPGLGRAYHKVKEGGGEGRSEGRVGSNVLLLPSPQGGEGGCRDIRPTSRRHLYAPLLSLPSVVLIPIPFHSLV